MQQYTGSAWTEAFYTATTTADDRDMWTIVKAYLAAGAHLVLVDPRPRPDGKPSKAPWDLRTPGEKNYDARAGISRDGGYGIATDSEDRLRKYLARAAEILGDALKPNLGVHIERSGLILVDADQAAEVQAVQYHATEGTDAALDDYAPTVWTPGVQEAGGQWVHKGGGHFVYTNDMPELGPVPELQIPGGAWVYPRGRQFLVPPSHRQGRWYRADGPVRRLSETPWLVELIREAAAVEAARAEERARRQAERDELIASGNYDTSVAEWNAAHTWHGLLTEDGWLPRGSDTCGCPVWTAPGPHDSHKSATAHDDGCTEDSVSLEMGSGPLMVWTDNPPEALAPAPGRPRQKRWTKAQYVCATRHAGDWGAFLRAAGLPERKYRDPEAFRLVLPTAPPGGIARSALSSPPPAPVAAPPRVETDRGTDPAAGGTDRGTDPAAGGTDRGTDPEAGGTDPEAGGTDPDTEVPEAESSWRPVDLTEILAGTYIAPTPSLMPRDDGLCLIYPGLVHSFHGESESGKSLVLQSVCAALITDEQPVAYIDYESDAGAIVDRLRQLGAPDEAIARWFTYIRPEARPNATIADAEWFTHLLGREYSLVVIDGVTDSFATFGLETTDNDDVTKWMRAFPRTLAQYTGAGVALIDHVTKATDGRGRFAIGAQAKMSGLDGAAYIVDVVTPLGRGRKGELMLRIGKDRPGYIRGRLPMPDEPRADRSEPVANVIVDSTLGTARTEVVFKAPNPLTDGGAVTDVSAQRRTLSRIMTAACDVVAAYGTEGISRTALRDEIPGKMSNRRAAIDALIQEGYLVAADGGNPRAPRARLIVARVYVADNDVFLHPELMALDPDTAGGDGPADGSDPADGQE